VSEKISSVLSLSEASVGFGTFRREVHRFLRSFDHSRAIEVVFLEQRLVQHDQVPPQFFLFEELVVPVAKVDETFARGGDRFLTPGRRKGVF
jgi:hypothetical protein